WISLLKGFKGTRVLSILKETAPSRWKEKDLFHYIRLPYTLRFPPPYWLRELEQHARKAGIGIIRTLQAEETLHPPSELDRGLIHEKDILHLEYNPSGWKDIGQFLTAWKNWKQVLSREGKLSFLLTGPFGYPFQILSTLFGSCLTYTSLSKDGSLIDLVSLNKVYRYSALGPRTKIFGIIGNPVLHSRSPLLHNRGYEQLGFKGVYVPFLVDDLQSFFPLVPFLGIKGLSVTVPFKEAVLPFCDQVEDSVKAVGACNTLVFSEQKIEGFNTDVEGFLAPLKEGLSSLKGINALVIGAGGAARSVVYALAREGARLLVLNRTVERAKRLAEEMTAVLALPQENIKYGPLDLSGATIAKRFAPELVVQTTSRGMHPAEKEDAFSELTFQGTEIVYDLVYVPRETLFLKRAAQAGCKIIYGDAMLVHQALRQFLLFTGKSFPEVPNFT
ncbi:MAG: shikimate dehydrogenase, partial [Spirochaetales bacterium]